MSEVDPPGSTHKGPDLFAKIGPLPAWAWGAIVVVGYILYSHWHSSRIVPTGDATPGTDNTAVPSSDTMPADSMAVDGSSAGYDYSTVNTGSYSGTTTGTGFTSNQQWAVAAIEQLIRAGVSASVATSGITHYLADQPLTADEMTAVTEAITLVGPPPLPQPLTSVTGTTVTQSGGSTTTEAPPTTSTSTDTTTVTAPAQTAPAPAPPTFTAPTYESGAGTQNPYIASDNVSLTASAATTIIAKLAAHGVRATSAGEQGQVGWEGWAPNLWIYTHGEQPTDPIAAYRGSLSTIVSPYSSASSAQAAMAAL